MIPITTDVECGDYSVKTDIYEGKENSAVAIFLLGRTAFRSKPRHKEFLSRLAEELGITSVIFDYTGHGDSPLKIEDRSAAQHFQEVLAVFDWTKEKYPNRKTFVISSSYGGFLATNLSQQRNFDALILQAPAIYQPSDFRLSYETEDHDRTYAYRRSPEELSGNPLLKNAKEFKGEVLLMVHKRDERIPKEVTDAYAKAFGCKVIVEDVPHSLGKSEPAELAHYNQTVFDWIKSNL